MDGCNTSFLGRLDLFSGALAAFRECITHTMHGTNGIFAYIYHKNPTIHVG